MIPEKRKNYKAVGPRLKKILMVVFGLFALLVVNSVYLVFVTIAGASYQNWFYLNMFMLHLILGVAIVGPVIAFGIGHIRNTRNRKNRRAVRVGYALFAASLLLLATGIILTRIDILGFRLEVNQPFLRRSAYWLHVLCPIAAIWLFIIHRLTGPKIKWRTGLIWSGVAAVFAGGMLYWQSQDPRAWNQEGPESGVAYFFPSLARTSNGNFIPAETLQNDAYCQDCHQAVHESWANSAHKFSSFNNPVYAFSVKSTRNKMLARDGHMRGARFCAGCHDPVPFFSGAFDDPKFDDPQYDLSKDPMAQAGITCTSCHAISHINSPRGNSDFTIDEPIHYPFAFSKKPILKWVNHQLIKAKPEFHKSTFLKPLHKSPEFCGSCHKVQIPHELNAYKWLRGQNHYDSFHLSGVSGIGVSSFYYPQEAEENCNGCHMPLVPVDDAPNFSARVRDESGLLKTLDHLYPSANTAMPHLLPGAFKNPEKVIQAHKDFNEGVMRVDIFGLKKGDSIDSPLTAPLGDRAISLEPGETYLLEIVVRTLKMGHLFTEGTADSNQVWLEATARMGDQIIGQSGEMDPDGKVDPWSHFLNSFVLDRQGNRIDRRNAEDIFVPLYNHQIPPGAADVIHYRLKAPTNLKEPITLTVALKYRKFDSAIMEHITDNPQNINDLPIMILATDEIVFSLDAPQDGSEESTFPQWMRWNDYGIGLLRKGGLGQLRQAKEAFQKVEAMGRPEGPLNLARVYLREGLVQDEAPKALARANEMGAYQWSLLWFGALVAKQNGDYPKAIQNLNEILRGGFTQASGRGFDFSKDYRLLNELASALYQRGLGLAAPKRREAMEQARDLYLKALSFDPENLAAHWGLGLVFRDLGNPDEAEKHGRLHAMYKPDDNARDTAFTAARKKYPAANKAAEAVVIYDLQRKE